MEEPADLAPLRRKRDQLTAAIAQIDDMRPGSLVARFRKCGKQSCHCARKGAKGHGPCYSLTHPVAGKTVTHVIPAGSAVDLTRRQLDEYHRFRDLAQQLVVVSEQICDLQLQQRASSSEDSIKKNRARRSSGD